MQVQIFTIPVIDGENDLAILNHFLRAHKIADIRKEIISVGDMPQWTFCVTYLPNPLPTLPQERRKEKTDYKEILDEEAFSRFVAMRQIRKQIATDEAIPSYAIFTDAELAAIARIEAPTRADLLKIPGIGQRKVEKYGDRFCGEIVADENDNQE
ncbi:MAG: HRDC domain-containing protein [Coprobacter sp.]|nr:HRDC domain-containing protein [Coprobacter sp.]